MATKATIPSEAQDGTNGEQWAVLWDSADGANLKNIAAYWHGRAAEAEAELAAIKSERDGLRDALTHANHMQRLTQDTRNALQAENDRLLAAVAELTEENKNVGAQMDSFADEIERLREALKPFADAADAYDPPEGDDRDIAWSHDFQIGALRRARAALNKEGA
jgi:gamma-glutamyl:cysteine ligase YbdK (ATP-grasp superfamily)